MFPEGLLLLGVRISAWNAAFGVALLVGLLVLRTTLRLYPEFGGLFGRYLAIAYLSAISAKFFANAFDANGSLWPPPETGMADWWLNPLSGPKTLYGVIVLMPAIVGIATAGARVRLLRALDLCSPAMFSVLAVARVGCFLQGCCYGTPSSVFGVRFVIGSPAHAQQVLAGLIQAGEQPVPVVPTQAIEAVFLVLVAWVAFQRLKGNSAVFVPAVAAYSVFRFSIEFFRADAERGFAGPLATSQWIALAVMLASAISFLRLRGERNGETGEGNAT